MSDSGRAFRSGWHEALDAITQGARVEELRELFLEPEGVHQASLEAQLAEANKHHDEHHVKEKSWMSRHYEATKALAASRAEAAKALEVLRATDSDVQSADLVTACHVVLGDKKSAESGLAFYKREAEAAQTLLAKWAKHMCKHAVSCDSRRGDLCDCVINNEERKEYAALFALAAAAPAPTKPEIKDRGGYLEVDRDEAVAANIDALRKMKRPGNAPPEPPAETEKDETEMENVRLWECPHCVFRFDAIHKQADGTYSCPNCAEAALTAERDNARAELAEQRARADKAEAERERVYWETNEAGKKLVARAEAERDALKAELVAGRHKALAERDCDELKADLERAQTQATAMRQVILDCREVLRREGYGLDSLGLEITRVLAEPIGKLVGESVVESVTLKRARAEQVREALDAGRLSATHTYECGAQSAENGCNCGAKEARRKIDHARAILDAALGGK